MTLTCPNCYGWGTIGNRVGGPKCSKCDGTGRLEISRVERILLRFARRLKKLLEMYG